MIHVRGITAGRLVIGLIWGWHISQHVPQREPVLQIIRKLLVVVEGRVTPPGFDMKIMLE